VNRPANKTLDRMTRSAVSRMFQYDCHWRAPRHRSALRSAFSRVMFIRPRLLFLFLLALVVVSCDFPAPPPRQGPVIQKDGQAFQLSHDDPNVQVGGSNEVRLSSRAQVAGKQLRETEWWIAREVVERQPRWDGLTTEPPLSVPKASALALPDVRRRFPEIQYSPSFFSRIAQSRRQRVPDEFNLK
jgi:hypothetical protein